MHLQGGPAQPSPRVRGLALPGVLAGLLARAGVSLVPSNCPGSTPSVPFSLRSTVSRVPTSR